MINNRIRQRSWEYHHKRETSTTSFGLWEDLETIFVDIDQTYNGGLFNPYESEFTRFIEENRVADAYLAPSKYHKEKSGEERRISYRDMIMLSPVCDSNEVLEEWQKTLKTG